MHSIKTKTTQNNARRHNTMGGLNVVWHWIGDQQLCESNMAQFIGAFISTVPNGLTHWGRVMYICVSKLLNIIGSVNGSSPGRCQAIIWTNAGILLIGPLGTNFSEILSEIHTFSFKKMHLKMLAILSRPQCVNLMNALHWHVHYGTIIVC